MPAKQVNTEASNPEAEELPDIDASPPVQVANRKRDSAEDEVKDAPENVVLYLGLFSERLISTEDWETAGVEGQESVSWHKKTGNTVPLDRFSEEALKVLSGMGEFRVIRSSEQ